MYKKFEGKTEYVYIRVRKSARFALEVLAEDLPNFIAKVTFPKAMYWNSQVMFSRPIRWILALHGNLVVPFSFAGILSGRHTHGLRGSCTPRLKAESAESYLDMMKNSGILVDMQERKAKIIHGCLSLARSVGGLPIMPEILLGEVLNLVEAPLPVLGRFDSSFLELPKDILIMVMQKQQKYIPIGDYTNENLLSFFIAVANGEIDEDVVRKGNEAVLRARYEDAKFFYKLDTQKKLHEFRPRLNGIFFHVRMPCADLFKMTLIVEVEQERLGTMLDKVLRIQKIVGKVGNFIGVDDGIVPVIEDAAELAMCDLATSVVKEFTSLSGIMARHYALRDGHPHEIADALFEITLPRFSGDVLPKTDVGTVLAISDRLDSLVGLFGAGCQPSSTSDPFGLRRITYGLVQILVENEKDFHITDAVRVVADVQPIEIEEKVIDDIRQFVSGRLEQLLLARGLRLEVIRSVLQERANSPYLAYRSAAEMNELIKDDLFSKVIQVYSRPTRITHGKDIDIKQEVNEAIFEQTEERRLWNAYSLAKYRIHPGVEFGVFLKVSSELIHPIDDFFENVYVMVDDEKIRNNRLALLKRIADLPKGIADLSVLPGF